MARIDITGNKYGKLIVIEYSHKDSRNVTYWKCLCECGNEKVIRGQHLKSGAIISCGCHKITHGLTNHWFFGIWRSEHNRCNNINNVEYHNYGGRGIQCLWTVEEACEWADNNPKPGEEYQLDRIDNNGNYHADNVRWVTSSENNFNRRKMDLSYYETTPVERGNFKKACSRRCEDYNNYIEVDSGLKNKAGKMFFYTKKCEESQE